MRPTIESALCTDTELSPFATLLCRPILAVVCDCMTSNDEKKLDISREYIKKYNAVTNELVAEFHQRNT